MKRIVVIDIEASGLQSTGYPIEIAWCSTDSCAVTSILIRPSSTWTSWDYNAEALHGISREQLMRDGVSVRDAANIFSTATFGAEIYSDAPDWDQYWLSLLLSQAGSILTKNVNNFDALISNGAHIDGRFTDIKKQAYLMHAPRHRAGNDVKRLLYIYRSLADPLTNHDV